jgi:hypothetical protein
VLCDETAKLVICCNPLSFLISCLCSELDCVCRFAPFSRVDQCIILLSHFLPITSSGISSFSRLLFPVLLPSLLLSHFSSSALLSQLSPSLPLSYLLSLLTFAPSHFSHLLSFSFSHLLSSFTLPSSLLLLQVLQNLTRSRRKRSVRPRSLSTDLVEKPSNVLLFLASDNHGNF